MHRHIYPSVVIFALLSVMQGATAAEQHESMLMVPNENSVKWRPGPADLPKGSQISILAGDPGQPGPFVLRVRFPPSTMVAPHRHATAENLTVISGDFYHAMGEVIDKSTGEQMKPGGFVYLPGQMPHYVWTTDTESVVQVTGTGPFGLIYVNPDDNPSKAN
ncbi:cupin domain-containing protein [Skermanella stibiiresistens]|uniref:cupin domain-containing protein n=1 Tax=Skermanella stibiiresistens TaxID=913326 RepID=UPI000A05A052|nr:cupin domain-containing protein [Skermanella stibiiresistens]